MDRLREFWRWFDRLSDVKKVATGSAVALFLFSSWLYSLGFLGLAASSRHVEAARIAPTPAATAQGATAQPQFAGGPVPTAGPEPTSSIYHASPPPPTSRPAIEPAVRNTPVPARTPAASPSAAVAGTATRPTPGAGTPGPVLTVSPTPTHQVPMWVTPGLPPTATVPAQGPAPTATPLGAAATSTPVRPTEVATPTPSH